MWAVINQYFRSHPEANGGLLKGCTQKDGMFRFVVIQKTLWPQCGEWFGDLSWECNT